VTDAVSQGTTGVENHGLPRSPKWRAMTWNPPTSPAPEMHNLCKNHRDLIRSAVLAAHGNR
jgi:hypothetical protein